MGIPVLPLSTLASANIMEIPKPLAMDDLEIQGIGSDSQELGSSQQVTPEHSVSTPKKEKLEKSSSRSYKSSKETFKEVYDADHKFISQIWDKRERDGSINLSTVATSSPIFKVLDHVM